MKKLLISQGRVVFSVAFVLLLAFCAAGAEMDTNITDAVRTTAKLRGVHRIVFLGDSITQAGDYVRDIECWLLAQGQQVEVLNLGLGSETVTDLTPQENAAHLKKYGFGRPFVSERLDRALAATKPDLLFACYGMNDGSSLPSDLTGDQRFAYAITHLRQLAAKAGVKEVVICTPPVHDAKGNVAQKFHDENLTRYTTWLLSKRAEGWVVVDIHTPMSRALEEGRAKNPEFLFAKDGVHPGREGHWLMARCVLEQYFGTKLEGVNRAEEIFPKNGAEIRKQINDRMNILFAAWMTQIRHQRPGVPGGPGGKPGPSVSEAIARTAEISASIDRLMKTD